MVLGGERFDEMASPSEGRTFRCGGAGATGAGTLEVLLQHIMPAYRTGPVQVKSVKSLACQRYCIVDQAAGAVLLLLLTRLESRATCCSSASPFASTARAARANARRAPIVDLLAARTAA